MLTTATISATDTLGAITIEVGEATTLGAALSAEGAIDIRLPDSRDEGAQSQEVPPSQHLREI